MRQYVLLMGMLGVLGPVAVCPPACATPPSLPPATGSAGLATIEGIDSDRDGIRDDIQRYIIRSAPDSARRRKALANYAAALQSALLVNGDEGKAATVHEKMDRAQDCVTFFGGKEGDVLMQRLKGQILNTHERIQAYTDYNKLLKGSVKMATPANKLKARCDFNPDALPD